MRLRADHFRRSPSRQDLATTVIERATGNLQATREETARNRMVSRSGRWQELHELRMAFDDRAHRALEHFPGETQLNAQAFDKVCGAGMFDERSEAEHREFRIWGADGLLLLSLRRVRGPLPAQQ